MTVSHCLRLWWNVSVVKVLPIMWRIISQSRSNLKTPERLQKCTVIRIRQISLSAVYRMIRTIVWHSAWAASCQQHRSFANSARHFGEVMKLCSDNRQRTKCRRTMPATNMRMHTVSAGIPSIAVKTGRQARTFGSCSRAVRCCISTQDLW